MGKKVINKVKEFFGLDNPDGAGIDTDIDFDDSGITEIEIENAPATPMVEPIITNTQVHKTNSPLDEGIGGANYQTIFLDPKTFSDCRKIADYIRDEKMVTLNLEYLDDQTAIRLMNFLSGAMTVQGAKYLIISKKVYTIFPKSMRIYYEGKKSVEPKIFDNFGGEERQ
ncbi:cell division protein SepF [Fusobacterium sp.]|uniref:cell division protein SepF n=1 Tax=Fusobacterium sp. TaxID=68766 RepID=UPI00396CE33B